MRALIVEHSRFYQEILVSLFSEAGFEVTRANTGEDGLRITKDQQFDLVCSSLHLKDMDGDEFAKKLRAQPHNHHVPMVMITSEQDKEVLERVLAAGITEIYRKSDAQQLSNYLYYFVAQHRHDERLNGRVLYVEDDQFTAQMIMIYLEEMGLQIDHFADAESALAAFKTQDYDLVLTDFFLEGDMSGSGLLREVRSLSEERAQVPVLVISGFSDDSRKIELLKSGASDYVSKPVIQEELEVRVKNLITNKQLLDRIKAQQQRLQKMAMTDQLTCLYNRHYLFDAIPRKMSEARRHNYPFGLVMIDLDHFKAINDTHGHAVGDEVLRAVGSLLKESCRNEDMVARFGGEEFVAVLSHCELEGVKVKAESLRKNLSELCPVGLIITASFGVAVFDPASPVEFAELFSEADKAVYLAKESGRNCVKVAAPKMYDIEVV